MKKKIAILGSTGSIGKNLFNILKKDNKKFEVILLTAKKNYKELIKQARFFNVKNLIITEDKYYQKAKSLIKKDKINLYNNFKDFKKIFNKKIDYTMSSIMGLDGLDPTIQIIKYTKKIAIANKESIICAWSIIEKELKKNKTQFVPVDSEHFSIWYALKNKASSTINKIYLTASGGPLLNVSNKEFDNIKISKILKHPNWKMGKKISIDSSTMMNKVFEVIEAKKIFNISYEKLSILIHPKSYLHAIVEFNDGMIKIIAHETTMDIPIFNSIYEGKKNYNNVKMTNIKKLNDLKLQKMNIKKFPIVNVLNKIPDKDTLFETVIVSANDELVNLFLKKRIKYSEISKNLLKFINMKEFKYLKNLSPKKISQINKLNKYVRFKINSMYI